MRNWINKEIQYMFLDPKWICKIILVFLLRFLLKFLYTSLRVYVILGDVT